MRRSVTPSVTITWALLGVLALGLSPTAGVGVLCIGSDGHAEVETMLAPCCASSEGRPVALAPATGHAAHGCTECADLLLDRPARLASGHGPVKSQALPTSLLPTNRSSGDGSGTATAADRTAGVQRRPYPRLSVELRL